jgi:hypothetical protein
VAARGDDNDQSGIVRTRNRNQKEKFAMLTQEQMELERRAREQANMNQCCQEGPRNDRGPSEQEIEANVRGRKELEQVIYLAEQRVMEAFKKTQKFKDAVGMAVNAMMHDNVICNERIANMLRDA